MIEAILQVLPDTKNIVVVLGNSPLEKFWLGEFRREFQRFTDRVSFTWFNDLSFEEMKRQAAALPAHSAIFYLFVTRDAVGVPYADDAALKSLSAIANAPIFPVFESQFGQRIVGGRALAGQIPRCRGGTGCVAHTARRSSVEHPNKTFWDFASLRLA